MKAIGISLIIAVVFVAGVFAQGDSDVRTIGGGEHWHVQFRLKVPATIVGSFESRDARDDVTVAATAFVSGRLKVPNTIQNNIEILILDERNYSRFSGGQSFVAAYDSGRLTSGNIKARLRPGSYHLVLSNKHSLLASKSVRLALGPTSRKLVFNPVQTKVDSRSYPLIDSAFLVPAGKAGYMSFNVTINQPSRISGRFTTTGGNNDIDFLIFDAVSFQRWQAGLYAGVFLQTGYVSGEQSIDKKLEPGSYVFVFDNRKSIITRKSVKALIMISPISP